ncbi:MAG: protein kinase [Gemmatimonadota bacterium]
MPDDPAAARPPPARDAALEERLREELQPLLELSRLLGRGSAAYVYLAREPALRRLVALKVLSPDLAGQRTARLRFEREAQSAARISHPSVVAVYRVGSLSNDLPYLVMQYVHGRSLAERLKAEGPLEVAEVRRILGDVAAALAAAHRVGIVHRDVKPSNVLYEEETGRVFLADFGIAAILTSGEEAAERLTTVGHVVGDPRYRSPEQLRGEEVTELADLYGLGLLGYKLLTGRGPFHRKSAAELVAAHLREAPPAVASLRADADPALSALLAQCLEKTPEYRPTAADAVRSLLAPGQPAAPLPSPVPTPASAPAVTPAPGERSSPRDRAAAAAPGEVGGQGAEDRATAELGEPAAPEPRVRAAVAPPGQVIRLHTLGSLELQGADGRRLLSVLAQPKRVALLALLAIGSRGGVKRRDTLVGAFWPDLEQDRARHALRQALYVLRRALGAEVVVSRGDEEIALDEREIWCDATTFESTIEAGRPAEALEWYRGDLLPGFFLSDAPGFERWLDAERQRLRRLASDAAWTLAAEEESASHTAQAAQWARRAVELDPWDESSLCRLLELLDRLGDRAGAIRAYERFSRALAAEYEAEPAPQTEALIQRIRSR